MTTRTRFLAGAGLAAIVAVGAAAAVHAQGPGGRGFGKGFGPGGGPGMAMGELGLRQLDLTDAQREQVRGIVQAHRPQMQQIAERQRAANKALHEAVTAGVVDEAAIREKSAELATVTADGAVLRAQVLNEVSAVLTPEQQQKLKDLRAKREERMEQRAAHMKERAEKMQERRKR